MSDTARSANRLQHETSPYLRQHAYNPVDWYPWGEEALQRAGTMDRPIFLSVGYSACHWCHVMEHESFEDPEVAALLNEHFVSIKVDREERPDIDQIYMAAVQLMTRHGGWPMSVFLTPDRRPFFGGTYFPPVDRYGQPSFKRVLQYLIQAWKDQRAGIEEQAEQLSRHVQDMLHLEPGAGELGPELLRKAAGVLGRMFDATYGGFGSAPKFPHPMDLRLLLRVARRWQDDDALAMVRHTLDRMAMGGIYDHLGGGFHRYSTDALWLVPHFEKMLYDNALLSMAYLEAFQVTAVDSYREVVEETLAYVMREMTSAEGAFYSTQDADSEGQEGKFFVWTRRELEEALGPDDAELFATVFDVTHEGNWEGHNILHRTRPNAVEARLMNMAEDELRLRLDASKKKLLEVRNRRVWPGRDEKFLTSWNGLMIAAFAKAFAVLERPEYLRAAQQAAKFVLSHMRGPDGTLRRTCRAGLAARLHGYLEDYSFLIDALISLYEADFNATWIRSATELAQIMIDQFWDSSEAGFFFTGRNHEKLIALTKDPQDSSIPSGNSMAVTALLRLARITGRSDFHDKAERTLALYRGLMEAAPQAVAQMLMALDFYLGPIQEFAVMGQADSQETRQVLQMLRRPFRPNQVLTHASAKAPDTVVKLIPLLAGKDCHGQVTTYICQNFTCREPIVGADALQRALNATPEI
jgi:uncharacterized protein YyaL (SSP411 family)